MLVFRSARSFTSVTVSPGRRWENENGIADLAWREPWNESDSDSVSVRVTEFAFRDWTVPRGFGWKSERERSMCSGVVVVWGKYESIVSSCEFARASWIEKISRLRACSCFMSGSDSWTSAEFWDSVIIPLALDVLSASSSASVREFPEHLRAKLSYVVFICISRIS